MIYFLASFAFGKASREILSLLSSTLQLEQATTHKQWICDFFSNIFGPRHAMNGSSKPHLFIFYAHPLPDKKVSKKSKVPTKLYPHFQKTSSGLRPGPGAMMGSAPPDHSGPAVGQTCGARAGEPGTRPGLTADREVTEATAGPETEAVRARHDHWETQLL